MFPLPSISLHPPTLRKWKTFCSLHGEHPDGHARPGRSSSKLFPPSHNIDRLAAAAIQSQLSGKYISRLRFVAGHCSTFSETGNPPPPSSFFFVPFLIRSNWSLIPFLLACYLEPSLYREGERRLNPVGLIAEEGGDGGRGTICTGNRKAKRNTSLLFSSS